MTDYKAIAELLFPDVVNTPEYYEKKYPKRNLPAGAEVTRIAPSPTGYLHIGHFFSALLDYKLAENSNGIFFFRLEDTDSKREVDGAGLVAVNVLNHYGIKPLEGLMSNGEQVGDYGPYIQSERIEIYKTYAKYLVSIGKAYPCFCEKSENKAEILERRENQLAENNDIADKDVCRNLSLEKIKENLNNGKKFAIRLKSENSDINNKIKIYDEIKGEKIITANMKDVVLLKSDGIPPYALAHAVDDHLMRTTIVVRGEDWFPSLSAHLEIFEALGFDKVCYAHTPVISKIGDNGNKRKISKRYDPEADMRYFITEGYPTESVVEYLMTLANTNFEEWRIENPKEDIKKFVFTLAKVSVSDPMFDIVKFRDVSKNVISKFTAVEVYNKILDWAVNYNINFYEVLKQNKDFAIDVFNIDRGGDKPRKDIAKWDEVFEYFNYMFKPYSKAMIDLSKTVEKVDEYLKVNIFKKYADIFVDTMDKDDWFNSVKAIAIEFNFCVDNKAYKLEPDKYNGNLSDICAIIRKCITGKDNTPDLFSISKVLTKKELVSRAEILSK